MTQVGLRTRLGDGFRARALRVGTSNLERAVRVVVLLGHAWAALLCLMIATGWRGRAVLNEISGDTYWPWQSIVTVVALGVVMVTISIGAVRSAPRQRVVLSGAALIIALFTMDALSLGSARLWLVALGLACTAAALTLPAAGRNHEAARCSLASAPAVMALVATVRSSDVDQALAAIRGRSLAPAASILLSLLTIFALATSVEGQRERTGRLLRWRVTRQAVIAAVVLKLLLLAGLYLHVTGGFLGGEVFWRPRVDQPLSWLHAALVAGLMVSVAAWSARRPLAAGGFPPRLAAVSLGVGIMEVAALATLVAITVVGTVVPSADTSSFFGLPNWVIDHVERVQVVIAGVILLAALAELLVRRALSAGLYLWLAAGLWLVPALIGIAFASDTSPTAWAAPGQVEAVVTVAVLAMVVTGRTAGLQPRALMVLVVVPFVVLHLDSFWPDAWMDHVTQIAVVAAVVIALWLNPPPAYADQRRNERSRSLLVAGQVGLLTLYLYLFNDAQLSGVLGSSTTIAWLWLGIPITAVLTARVAGRMGAGPEPTATASEPGHA